MPKCRLSNTSAQGFVGSIGGIQGFVECSGNLLDAKAPPEVELAEASGLWATLLSWDKDKGSIVGAECMGLASHATGETSANGCSGCCIEVPPAECCHESPK
mmetsp:Transcript_80668/g.226949  ORF Transcript_80668/g.226949 Transcript_80668/m.226949 type:complete len:102 (-) Transcript_80668:725-1030(-)